jgi:hypothetical protein
MDKTEVAGFEKCEADFGIGMNILLVIEGIMTPNPIGSIKDSICRSENVQPFEQVTAANIPSAH